MTFTSTTSTMMGTVIKISGTITFGRLKAPMPNGLTSARIGACSVVARFCINGLTPIRSSKMTSAISTIVEYTEVKIEIETAFAVPNQRPTSDVSRSKYGISGIAPNNTPAGMSTPANDGCMCSNNSCRFKKYHGALDGFGVRSGLACASSGDCMMIDTTTRLSRISIDAMNSMVTRCGQTYTSRSDCSAADGAGSRLATAATCSRRVAAAAATLAGTPAPAGRSATAAPAAGAAGAATRGAAAAAGLGAAGRGAGG